MDTIVSLIEQSCKKFDSRAAFLQRVDGVWRETTYRRLSQVSDGIAAGLLNSGFRPGDHAALLASSSPEWVMAYLGILKACGVVVPIDRELRSVELGHILTHSEARVLFVDRDNLKKVLALTDVLPPLEQIVTLASPAEFAFPGGTSAKSSTPGSSHNRCAQTFQPLNEFLAETVISPVSRQPHDTALIIYTSGTTGRSKGAMLSHANIVSNIRGTAAHLRMDETVHTLSFLPINHVFEQVCGIMLPLALGGKVSFCESLKKLGENLAEVKPTFFVGVPAVYRMLLDRVMKNINEDSVSRFLFTFPLSRPLVAAKVRKRLGSGTIFVSGGAALDPEIAAGLGKFGITIIQGYGITETSPVIAAEAPGNGRLGTVGRVLAGIEVKIDSPNDGQVGEILIKGPNVMQGYFKDPGATAEMLVDGWYRTGDLGSVAADGFLSICGRLKNLIVTSNGRNVYPEEVESEILKSPYVAEVVVYPHRTGQVTEEILAMIYPNQEALAEHAVKQGKPAFAADEVEKLLRVEISQRCEHLAAYKRVKRIIVRREEFPKTTTGKIKRYEVGRFEDKQYQDAE